MNRQRAEQIVQTGELKHVTYQGERIYIQQIDKNSDTARVYPLDDPQKEFDVPISQLVEKP
ncbi:H-type small acid-soluble spore protein [Lederbergia sp. NSJ-179]|uniref:H-type small acid-soluble spore protein n=1 Tax=Lederbergia sp. NSJ-179 TaxID=2931402 RepID=UPI001FD4E166|nr:H-type small acid-soluble spore protein [Lederbergia sp. NSJ-179]MCJ7841029.1 H-type small acid-soluble spore protein [Lederbergia sp. NSJ-179]